MPSAKQSTSVILIILRIEVNNLLQIQVEQRRTIIVHKPQHVLEENRIHIHKNHSWLLAFGTEILHSFIFLHGIYQKTKRALFQYERVDQKHPLLFSDHYGHRTLRFVQHIFGERPIAMSWAGGAPSDQGNRLDQAIHERSFCLCQTEVKTRPSK